METVLALTYFEIAASVGNQERLMLVLRLAGFSAASWPTGSLSISDLTPDGRCPGYSVFEAAGSLGRDGDQERRPVLAPGDGRPYCLTW